MVVCLHEVGAVDHGRAEGPGSGVGATRLRSKLSRLARIRGAHISLYGIALCIPLKPFQRIRDFRSPHCYHDPKHSTNPWSLARPRSIFPHPTTSIPSPTTSRPHWAICVAYLTTLHQWTVLDDNCQLASFWSPRPPRTLRRAILPIHANCQPLTLLDNLLVRFIPPQFCPQKRLRILPESKDSLARPLTLSLDVSTYKPPRAVSAS
jgi:hypothetical protein